MQRKHVSLKEKLAATLWELARHTVPLNSNGEINPIRVELNRLRYEAAPPDEVIKLFDFDHSIYFSHEGGDHWGNLTPMLRADHREKTRRDIATIAKGKRIQKKEARHRAAMTMKGNHDPA